MIYSGQDQTGGKIHSAWGLPRLNRCSPDARKAQGRANASVLGVLSKKSAYLMPWHSKTQQPKEREHLEASTVASTTENAYYYKLSQTG